MSTEGIDVTIKYLGSLRDETGLREERVGFQEGSTLDSVAGWLEQKYGLRVPGPGVMAILNGKGWGQFESGTATELHEDDTICLFPPIGGG
jgi:molybdopterin converting factor small subunit